MPAASQLENATEEHEMMCRKVIKLRVYSQFRAHLRF